MAEGFQDDDEMSMENNMEKIRLAVSSYEIDQFSNKLQRNMMERRQHFDVKDRINIKNTIDFMKRNIPIDETLPLDRKLHAFAIANNFEIKCCDNEIYLSSPDFIMSVVVQNETVEDVEVTWFRCSGNGIIKGTTIKKLINENKFRILSQKIKLYLQTIDSSFTSDEKEKIFNILLQEDEEYANLSNGDLNSGPIGKFVRRTDIEPSYLCIFCDKVLLYQQNTIPEDTFKCFIEIVSDNTNPVLIESTNIKYAYMLRFSRPLLMFDGFIKELISYSCHDMGGSLKADVYTQILGITKRKKNLITNEKFQPTVRYLVDDELIYRNRDLVVNSVTFTVRNNLNHIIEIIRVQLLLNHLIESIKRDCVLEQFIMPKNICDININQPSYNILEFTLDTLNNMKLLLQIKVKTIDDIYVNGIFSNGDTLDPEYESIFLTVLLKSWSIPLSILALMKKLGFDTKYNFNINCLKKQSFSEISKVGNAWHYFLKFTKKWQKKKLKKMKLSISNIFIDNPVLLNGKAVDILGTLIPIQSDIDMTYLKPKQALYPSHPSNVNNSQRISFNKNIQKQNVVDVLPIKPKSDLEAMAEIGQNLSKDNNSFSQKGGLTKYSDNIIKTPTVIGKYPVQNDTSQFVPPINSSGNVQGYQQNLSLKNIVPTSSVNSSTQNPSHTKHKKSKNKKPDFTEGVFKVPNINILPTSSLPQQPFPEEGEIKKHKKDSVNKKSKKVKKSVLSEPLASVTHQQDSLKVTFSRLPLESHPNKIVDDPSLNSTMKASPTFSTKVDFKIKHEVLPEEKNLAIEKNKELLESVKAKSKLKKMLENSNQSIRGKLGKNMNDIACEVEIDKALKQEAVISPPSISIPPPGSNEPPPNSELKIKIKRPKITIKNLEPPKPREVQEVKEVKEEVLPKIVDLSTPSPKIKEQPIKKGGIILSKSKSTVDSREKKSNKRKATDHTPSPRSKSSKKDKLDLNPPPLLEQAPADTFNAIGKKNAFDLLKNFRIPKLEGKEEKVIEKPIEKPVEKPIEKNEKIEKIDKIEKIKEKVDKNKDIKFKERHKERDREREREKERERCRDKYIKERESSKRKSLSPINRGNIVSPSKIPKLENYSSSIKPSNDKTTTSTTDITKLVGFIPLAAIKPSTHPSLSQNRHSSRSHSNSSDHYRAGNYSSHSRKSSVNDNHHSSSRSHHASSSSHNNHRSLSKSSILPKSPLTSPTSTSSGSKWVKMSQPVQQPMQIQTKILDQRIRNEQQGKQMFVTREPSPCDLTIDESDN
uniref:Mediator complex subunit 1 n=1 Tax=Strongyloides stercoralis TaxID=6248 RepID=A0A0K0EJP2_STRER